MNKSESAVDQSKVSRPAMPMPDRASSQGNSSASVTPKDVSPEDATAKDVTERKMQSDDLEVRQEALLDEAIELTFPASDPISVPSYDKAEQNAKATPIPEESGMTIVVPNTRPDEPRVTLFGQLNDGGYAAEVMDEDAVPYTAYWEHAIDQTIVYIDPNDDQLDQMINALNEGKLEFSRLQNFGATNGGISVIAI